MFFLSVDLYSTVSSGILKLVGRSIICCMLAIRNVLVHYLLCNLGFGLLLFLLSWWTLLGPFLLCIALPVGCQFLFQVPFIILLLLLLLLVLHHLVDCLEVGYLVQNFILCCCDVIGRIPVMVLVRSFVERLVIELVLEFVGALQVIAITFSGWD
jgi:hypothetical protein